MLGRACGAAHSPPPLPGLTPRPAGRPPSPPQPRPLGALVQAWLASALLTPLYWLFQKLVAAKVGLAIQATGRASAWRVSACRLLHTVGAAPGHGGCAAGVQRRAWRTQGGTRQWRPLAPRRPVAARQRSQQHAPCASFPQVRTALGVRKFVISGGGSLSPHLDAFFESIGLAVLNGWGLTETSPVLACRRGVHNVRGSVGERKRRPWGPG